jgi:UDP-N-acetyl-2-amino-2-deoxyglucuronate dehydrogenase
MTVKFALVGAGHIGKRHAEMINRNPEAELVAVADPNGHQDAAVLAMGTPVYADLETLLEKSPDFDVLCVATPNGLHASHALLGLQHKKHIVIEKPMALTKADCEKMIHKAMAMHRMVFCVMQNRYSPPAEWIKTVMDQGKLGRIFMVQVNCYWNRDDRYYKNGGWKGTQELDGGTLFTQFSHFVDMMYWLFGDVQDIKATFADFNHSKSTEFEDSGTVNFKFSTGGLGCINYSTGVWDKNFESSLTIIAEHGTVKIGGQYMNEVEYCHIKDYEMPVLPPSNPANDYGPYKGSAANHNYIFDNVIEAIKRGGMPTTNAMDGLKVVEIIENIYRQNDFFASKKALLAKALADTSK